VTPRKLELLESDQYDQLPDATFTRALAQAVCRTLKVDPAPVLALLPPPNGHRLEQVSEGLNTPFHERPGRFVPRDWLGVTSPALWVAGLLVVGAVVMYLLPAGWLPVPAGAVSRTAPSAPVAMSAGAPASEPLALPGAEAVSPDALLAASAAARTESVTSDLAASASALPAVAAGVLQLRTTAQSWVEVVDARGQSILGRLVQPGESVGLDGVMPLKVRIGNASATQVVFRGQSVELAPFTRDNVARLELK
jgi:cytoskeleton protein RodZ